VVAEDAVLPYVPLGCVAVSKIRRELVELFPLQLIFAVAALTVNRLNVAGTSVLNIPVPLTVILLEDKAVAFPTTKVPAEIEVVPV
jgi:hypothetical protein